jgi:transcription initiation factor TFIIIB Brf1 subunit/transcription initiation factor TFIIB
LPDKIKDRALDSVKEIDGTNGTSPIIKACCAVILAAEEIGLQLATGKVASVTGVTAVALRQALLRFKG